MRPSRIALPKAIPEHLGMSVTHLRGRATVNPLWPLGTTSQATLARDGFGLPNHIV